MDNSSSDSDRDDDPRFLETARKLAKLRLVFHHPEYADLGFDPESDEADDPSRRDRGDQSSHQR